MGGGILKCSWKSHRNVMGAIDLGVGETKPFNEKFTAVSIRNYIWFQNNQCLHLYGSLTVLEPIFGNMTTLGIHVEFLNTYQKEGKKTLS